MVEGIVGPPSMKSFLPLLLLPFVSPGLFAQSVTTTGNVIPGTPVSPNWNTGGNLSVGETADGTVNVSGGATVTNATGWLGTRRPYKGTMNVDGGGSTWTSTADIAVGNDGSGYLNITNGGKVTNRDGYVAINTASYGAVVVSGQDSWWENRSLFLGNQSNGYVTIRNGGKVTARDTRIGGANSAYGELAIEGAGSVFENSWDVDVRQGNITVASGGKLSVGMPGSPGFISIGTGGNHSALNIGSANLSSPTTAGTVEAEGGVYLHTFLARLNFNQTDTTTFSSPISGEGTVYQQGTGTTILTGSHDHTGSTLVLAGKLVVNGAINASSLTVGSGGTLGGYGDLYSVNASAGSFISPDGVLTITHGLTWQSGATMLFDLGGGAADLLDMNGDLWRTGAGGQHVFDFTDAGWQEGQTYTLIEFGSTNFDESDFSYSNGGPFAGDFILEGNSLKFHLTSIPEPSAYALGGLGLAALVIRRKRRSDAR